MEEEMEKIIERARASIEAEKKIVADAKTREIAEAAAEEEWHREAVAAGGPDLYEIFRVQNDKRITELDDQIRDFMDMYNGAKTIDEFHAHFREMSDYRIQLAVWSWKTLHEEYEMRTGVVLRCIDAGWEPISLAECTNALRFKSKFAAPVEDIFERRPKYSETPQMKAAWSTDTWSALYKTLRTGSGGGSAV